MLGDSTTEMVNSDSYNVFMIIIIIIMILLLLLIILKKKTNTEHAE